MSVVVVLAAHGAPPTDYPPKRVGMLMALEFTGNIVERVGFLRAWRDRLDHEIRHWQRTDSNDPYKNGVESLAAQIAEQVGCPVIVGYNEFCNPTIAEAIDRAVTQGATRVVVATTMFTRGGDHSEREIRELVESAQVRHPGIAIVYAWPYDQERVAQLYADQLNRFF
ncbi:sirohydrochlorin ferrochelatase [Anaerolineae bacterium]|nr:sirohydrochlorin ferrochelatase [Anaerolineae bacterium]